MRAMLRPLPLTTLLLTVIITPVWGDACGYAPLIAELLPEMKIH